MFGPLECLLDRRAGKRSAEIACARVNVAQLAIRRRTVDGAWGRAPFRIAWRRSSCSTGWGMPPSPSVDAEVALVKVLGHEELNQSLRRRPEQGAAGVGEAQAWR